MNSVATLSKQERGGLFRATAEHMRFHPVNVEKDFWVCWLLKQLYSIPEFENMLVFKGGTSLSKCFNLIHRFSEDIDLAVNFERLGFIDDKDPRQTNLSNTRRQRLLDEMLIACKNYIADPFLKFLSARIKNILGDTDWILEISSDDPQTVNFVYPGAMNSRLAYIHPHVALELGTHAEPIPNSICDVQPYAAKHYPKVFMEPSCSVTTVVAKRTFWEKATILHAEYFRSLNKPLPIRYSRHYADLASMTQVSVKDEALEDINLLHDVCVHKDRFYHCGWARYMEACPGSFHLLPRAERLTALQKDHRAMKVMFFNSVPEFDSILEKLANLESELNSK